MSDDRRTLTIQLNSGAEYFEKLTASHTVEIPIQITCKIDPTTTPRIDFGNGYILNIVPASDAGVTKTAQYDTTTGRIRCEVEVTAYQAFDSTNPVYVTDSLCGTGTETALALVSPIIVKSKKKIR